MIHGEPLGPHVIVYADGATHDPQFDISPNSAEKGAGSGFNCVGHQTISRASVTGELCWWGLPDADGHALMLGGWAPEDSGGLVSGTLTLPCVCLLHPGLSFPWNKL